MIQNSVKISLYGLIGWRQSTVSGMPTVDAANLAASSGLMFQDFSPLVTIQNVYDCQEDPDATEDEFNTMLANLVKSAILKILNAVFTQNDFIENKVLYPYENEWTETITNDTSFVGFEFQMAKRKDYAWRINQVFTAFDASDTVKLLLFHSSRKTAIDSKEITVSELTEDATDLSWDLSQFNYAGGKFYVGYLRSGLTAKAVNRNWDRANDDVKFKTLRIQPIRVPGWDAETLFDVDDIDYEDETFGLNFDITAWKDYTNVIVQNKDKFVNAIGYQVAADVLDLILKSVRSNRIERLTEGQVLYELEGLISADVPRSVGIVKKLSNEIEDLKKNFVYEKPLIRGTIG